MEDLLTPQLVFVLQTTGIIVFTPILIIFLVPLIPFLIRKVFYNALSPKLVCMRVKIASYDETNFKNFEQFFAGIHAIKKPWWKIFKNTWV